MGGKKNRTKLNLILMFLQHDYCTLQRVKEFGMYRKSIVTSDLYQL